MLTRADLRALLAHRSPLIIDGALATELEKRGHNLNHALWSAKILRDDPDAIKQVHLDYYLAGADIATTASYQATPQGLADHFGLNDDASRELIVKSVRLAQIARIDAYGELWRTDGPTDANNPRRLLVAGSVGPYGAYLADGSEYRGDYQRPAEEFKDFHRPRIQALVDASVDLLAIETMPSMPEIEAVCSLLDSEFRDAVAWISCSLKDAEHLSDGTPLQSVLDFVAGYDQVVAFGVNCVPVQLVEPAMRHLSSVPSDSAPLLLCYPNSGEVYDAASKTWSGSNEHGVSGQVRKWTNAGAKLVGGCCRTGPKDIKAIIEILREFPTSQATMGGASDQESHQRNGPQTIPLQIVDAVTAYSNGSSAKREYMMQLMLVEHHDKKNKEGLLNARQEQDNTTQSASESNEQFVPGTSTPRRITRASARSADRGS